MASIKARRPSAWPIGATLRFKRDADVQAKYRYLRGTPVTVVGALFWSDPTDGVKHWSWRQMVFAYALGREGRTGPDQLEPIPELDEPRSKKTKRRSRQPTAVLGCAIHLPEERSRANSGRLTKAEQGRSVAKNRRIETVVARAMDELAKSK